MTTLTDPQGFRPGARLGLVAVAVAVVGAAIYFGTHRGPSINTSRVAAESGATSCLSSGYKIESRLDGSEQVIYTCSFSDGSTKCVTERSGIATDSTDVVRLLFSNTLNGRKPDCI